METRRKPDHVKQTGRMRTTLTGFLILALTAAALAQRERETHEVRLYRIGVETRGRLSEGAAAAMTGLREGETYPLEHIHAGEDSLLFALAADGWFLATVPTYTPVFSEDSSYITLQITVDEGPEAVVDTLLISGPLGGREPEIRARLRSREGDLFHPAIWTSDLERTLAWLEDQGYPFARVETRRLTPRFEGELVAITAEMKVTPGLAVTIDHVEVAGLERTRPQVARRILALKPGHRYNPRRAERARRRLQRTGWFARVQTPEVYREGNGEFGLIYPVAEQPTSSISGALGYAPDAVTGNGLAGGIDALFGNLFGTGRRFSLNWQRDGESQRTFALGYREPYVLGAPVNLDLHFSQEVVDSVYVTRVFGLEAAYLAGMTWELTGGVERRDIHADSLAQGIDSLSYSLVGFSGGVRIDTRDRASNPSSGGLYVMKTTRFIPTDDTGADQFVHHLDARHNRPLLLGWVLHGRLAWREVTVQDGEAPFAEWVRIGGEGSLRGYLQNSLAAPRAGWATLELRRLLGPESRVFALADAAVLARPDATEWKQAFGLGIQVATPAGLMKIALAVPSDGGVNQAVVHASVATRF